MKSLELIIPPPVVMLVTGVVMWVASMLLPVFTVTAISGAVGAAFIGVAGLAISVAGVVAFKRASTTIDPRHPADASALVTSGIYRHTRNPMYLGTLLVLVGWAVFLGNVLALLCTLGYVAYINRYQIRPEERMLQDKFGANFSAYKARVRRWI